MSGHESARAHRHRDGGLTLASDPHDTATVRYTVWSYGSEYELLGTVETFSEYLYGLVHAVS